MSSRRHIVLRIVRKLRIRGRPVTRELVINKLISLALRQGLFIGRRERLIPFIEDWEDYLIEHWPHIHNVAPF